MGKIYKLVACFLAILSLIGIITISVFFFMQGTVVGYIVGSIFALLGIIIIGTIIDIGGAP